MYVFKGLNWSTEQCSKVLVPLYFCIYLTFEAGVLKEVHLLIIYRKLEGKEWQRLLIEDWKRYCLNNCWRILRVVFLLSQQESRGIKDPERLKAKQAKREEIEKKAEHSGQGGTSLKVSTYYFYLLFILFIFSGMWDDEHSSNIICMSSTL